MFTLTTEAITAVLAQYEDSIFARRSYQQLVIVIPQLSLTEAGPVGSAGTENLPRITFLWFRQSG